MITKIESIYRLVVGDKTYIGTMRELEMDTFYTKNTILRIRQYGKLGGEKASLELIEKKCPLYNIYKGKKEKILYKEKGSKELSEIFGCRQATFAQYANKYYKPKNLYIERLY